MYLPPPSTLVPGLIVDSYRRDSGGMRQDQSTDQQLAELEAYCQKHNLIHRNKFVDEARSGGTTAGRDDFNRMLDLYTHPDQRPRGLLLWNYARFARDIDDAQFNKIRLRQWGITVHSLNDSIPEGEHGRIIEFLIDVANEEKRKQTSADAKRGLKDLVLKYKCVPGKPPRGFKRERVHIGTRRDKTEHFAHKWVPDLEMKARIYTAFEMKAAGASLRQIHHATHLFSAQNSYSTFFANPLYIGVLKFGDLTVEDYCEPMIDRSTWNAVQKILERSRQNKNISQSETHPRRQGSAYLLSGIAYCGRCGSPLWGMTSRQRSGTYYYRYACTRAKRRKDCDLQPIPAHVLEGRVIQSLHEFVSNPNNLADIMAADLQEYEQAASKTKRKISEKQKELGAVRRSITNITDAIAELKNSPGLLKKLDQLESQETQLQSELLQLKNATPETEPPLTAQEILLLSTYLDRVLQGKDPGEIRMGLLSITRRIVVDRRGNEVFGLIRFKKRRREPRDDEDGPDIITASKVLSPVGAPSDKRSIPFFFTVNSNKKPR